MPGASRDAGVGTGQGRRGLACAAAVAVILLTAPLAGETQVPASTPARVGFLGHASPTVQARAFDAFLQGRHELGWVEGQTVVIEARWAGGDLVRPPALDEPRAYVMEGGLPSSGVTIPDMYRRAASCADRQPATSLIGPDGPCLAHAFRGREPLLAHEVDPLPATGFCARRCRPAFYSPA